MNSRLCSAYGLLCSVNFPWSWCPTQSAAAADVCVVLGELGPFVAYPEADYRIHAQRSARTPGMPPVVLVERGLDGHFRVSYADGARFIISATASQIFGVSRSQLTLDDLLVYLQGPILGFVLRLRGLTCLHASAVTVDGRAIAVVGKAGMGKSTSAATFALMGLPVLTDDVLALHEGSDFHVQPGLPRVLLWPASAAALFGDPDALPRIVSTWDKRYLDLTQPGFRFAAEAAPLAAIYVLGDRLEAAAHPQITELNGTSAMMRLVANTYANDFLDAPKRAAEMKSLGRLINQVPVRQVRAPHDRAALPRICEAIVSDARTLQRG